MTRILLIDDDLVDREAVVRLLSAASEPCHVIQAATGGEALDIIEADPPLDCILLDYRLPDADGLELLASIDQTSGAPVVMLTGDGDETVAVQAMKAGAIDYMPKARLSEADLCRVVATAMRRAEELRQRQCVAAEHERLAFSDPLTGLGNRRFFDAQIERQVAVSGRNGAEFCLMLLDLNGFKGVNDAFGHQAGDLVIKAIAARMLQTVRLADSLFRIGGDEFAIIVETGVSPNGLSALTQRIREALAQPIDIGDQSASVTASVGVGIFPLDDRGPTGLFRIADERMYADKRRQRARRTTSSPTFYGTAQSANRSR